MKIIQQWSLLFAGAIASVIGGYFFTQHEEWISSHGILFYSFLLVIFLLVVSILPLQKIIDSCLLKLSKSPPHKIGILNDMGWDKERPVQQFAAGADTTNYGWKEQIVKDAKANELKVNVKFIHANQNFYTYSAILNPYGGVYPEEDLANTVTLSKIFDYVSKGGIFVNVADVPGFWAYNTKLQRKSVAVPAIPYVKEGSEGLSVNSLTLVAFAPFVQKLGLNVNPWEKEEKVQWEEPVKYRTERFQQLIKTLRIDRIAVVERNVEPVLTLAREKSTDEIKLTPLFLANYGSGRFIISLIYQNSEYNPNNPKLKEILSLILIQTIKRT